MTWPEGIALALGIVAAYLITRHQHRSTTQTQHTRTENGHGHQDTPQDHTGQEDDGEEGHPGPQAGR